MTNKTKNNIMKHIGEVLLIEVQRIFICSMINMYGDGQHPMCDSKTFDYFTIIYVKELTEKPEVEANLSPDGIEMLNDIKALLVNPCSHYDVKVNSLWDYDRSLDHSQFIIHLRVKEVKDGKVTFYEDMPYKTYGIEYFDGKIFKPHVQDFQAIHEKISKKRNKLK